MRLAAIIGQFELVTCPECGAKVSEQADEYLKNLEEELERETEGEKEPPTEPQRLKQKR